MTASKAPDIFKDCPFPEVAESLRPFIKSRQEATQIRQGLHATLPLLPTLDPQSLPLDHVDPSTLTGVRKAYWRALQAHRAAQAQYDSLKSELEVLVQPDPPKDQDYEDPATFLADSYVPLLRQKDKHRKLKVIEKTCARVLTAGGDTIGDTFDKVAKRNVGELPVPPSTSTFAERDGGLGSEYDLTELKKAILFAKQQVVEHESTAPSSEETDGLEIDPHADLRGVQQAHSELTSWMETQLGLISSVNSSENADGPPTTNGTNGNGINSTREIERLYEEDYLEARKRLLATITNPPSNDDDSPNTSPVGRRGPEPYDVDQRMTASEALLPHLPDLLATKRLEQSLLRQGAYTRRQLASAEAHTQAVLIRLADESHLVEPDLKRQAPHGKDWTDAAETAREATYQFAMQRINAGKLSARTAAKTLQAVREMPDAMNGFLE